jgi:hypothetical protein
LWQATQYLVTRSRGGVAGAAPVEAEVCEGAAGGALACTDREASKPIAAIHATHTHVAHVFRTRSHARVVSGLSRT